MKSFKIDRTKILSIVTASILLLLILTGCGKKKAVVTSLTTMQTTELTTATTTTEEETTTTEEETETTTTEVTTQATTTEEETTTTKKKTSSKTTKKKTTPAAKVKVSNYKATVYAKNKMNVRSGPGTNYKIVKTIEKGSAIDVRGKTSNGWYKTINGNYVLAKLTSKTAPKTNTNNNKFE